MTQSNEELDIIKEIARLKGRKYRNGTRIHYLEVRLERVRTRGPQKSRSKPSPKRPQIKKLPPVDMAKACPENTAYVLSRETHDIIKAIEALERLR